MAAGGAVPHTSSSSSSIHKDSAMSKRKRANRSAILNLCKQAAEPIQAQRGLHAHTSDPGEVINPKSFSSDHPTVSGRHSTWASVLNSRTSTEPSTVFKPSTRGLMKSEPDICLVNLQMKEIRGNVHTDTSPSRSSSGKSGHSLFPKPKGNGPRRCRDISNYRSYKENEALQTRRIKGLSQGSPDVRGGRALPKQGGHLYGVETEEGWEAAADVLGLSIQNPSGLLPTPAAYQRHMKSKSTPVNSKVPRQARSCHCQSETGQAWIQNGSGRPSSLPGLSRQWEGSIAADSPPQCLICCNDLDSTDTLFQCCPCGFKLCLFCYHRIYSETGKCPACRSVYTRDVSAKPSVNLPQ